MKKILYILPLLFLFSCTEKTDIKPYYFSGEALGTTYHITAIPTNDITILTSKDIDSVIVAIDNSLSTYQNNSLISRLNKGEVLQVDQQFTDVYKAAKKIYIETGGMYDPTIGILVNAWGFGPTKKMEGIEKNKKIVDSLKRYVGYDMIGIDEQGFFKKKYPQIYVDYNSIAKGYAIDRVGKMLINKGFNNYLVEIGGEVLAKGMNTFKNRDWLVAIDNPNREDSDKFISRLKLRNQAMATSGNYRKFYIDKETGKKYVHTLNPKSGFPIQSNLLSASVVAENCTLADGYATAFMVLGFEKTKTFLKKHPELKAFLVYSDTQGKIQTYKTNSLNIVR